MERWNAADGEPSPPVGNIEESLPGDRVSDAPPTDTQVLPLDAAPLVATGILPAAGTLGASTAGGMGSTLGTSGPLLAGASLYPVVTPLTATSGGDQSLADRIESALADDGRFSPFAASQIHPAVSGGVVLLTGTVGSETERTLAERLCAHVAGVSRVENQLTVAVA